MKVTHYFRRIPSKDSVAIAEVVAYLSRNNPEKMKFTVTSEFKSLDLDNRAEELQAKLEDLDMASFTKIEHIAEVSLFA